ncbi:MAG: DUF1178 family protein [Burkholderiaceae bacterium]|jgi:hypothetical protein|nr:DUF1178 family protein [Burkholderiaceae bacterium]
MKVLDLHCEQAHTFEGWFASEDDFQGQLARGLLECPLCGDKSITKRLSAPRLNLGRAEPDVATTSGATTAPGDQSNVAALPPAAIQAAWLRMVRQVMARTEDVGERFAEEARRIHYGEADERAIRGQATRQQTEALLEEGIAVMPLPIPVGLKEPLQ